MLATLGPSSQRATIGGYQTNAIKQIRPQRVAPTPVQNAPPPPHHAVPISSNRIYPTRANGSIAQSNGGHRNHNGIGGVPSPFVQVLVVLI